MGKLIKFTASFLLLVSCCPVLADGEFPNGIVLEGTNVTVFAPNGWWFSTHSHSIPASVSLLLPHPLKGGYEAGPDLQVWFISDHLKVHSLSTYEQQALNDRYSKQQKRFYRTKIAGRPALVSVTTFDRIIDFVGGTGTTEKMVSESIVIQDGSRLYRCTLTTEPRKYKLYKGSALKLCSGLRFNARK